MKTTYHEIEIAYDESDDRWHFELRGRKRSTETLSKAKEAIDKEPAEKRKQTFPHKVLLESIKKWRQIERGEMADCGTDNCSLCMEFIADGCVNCPVRQNTGHIYCHDTPYERWCRQQGDLGRCMSEPVVADTPQLVRLARAERRFLESLLP